jgi:ERCC4-type nuclease
VPLLQKLGCEVESTRLDFADAAWLGWGPNGAPVNVGVEIKQMSDAMACCVSGRFAGHQLPGLLQSYDDIWLLLRGEWRARPGDGVLEERRQGRGGGMYWAPAGGGQRLWMWRDFENWINSMTILGGLRVHRFSGWCERHRTIDWCEGALWLKTLHGWYSKEEHKSHQVIYSGKHIWQDQALLNKPTLARRVACELPHIGVKRSAEVARVFHTVAQMVEASPRDWMQVEGVGKKIATEIHRVIHHNGDKPK